MPRNRKRKLARERGKSMRHAWQRPRGLLSKTFLIVLLLLTLLPVSANASTDTQPSDVSFTEVEQDSLVLVPRTMILEANRTIDALEYAVAVRDSQIAAQRDLYIELLDLKDRRIEILEGAVEDALGSPTKTLLDRLTWGLAGYGMGRMAE